MLRQVGPAPDSHAADRRNRRCYPLYLRTGDGRPLAYKAGQFVIVEVNIDDEVLHRAYSLSSSRPETFGDDQAGAGRSRFQPPDRSSASRALPERAVARRDFNIIDRTSTAQVVLISAGCGITPRISIARWLLDMAPDVAISLSTAPAAKPMSLWATRSQRWPRDTPTLRCDQRRSRLANRCGAAGLIKPCSTGCCPILADARFLPAVRWGS